jgi:membrane protein implicated in regulation of membrane protease activity
VQKLRIGSTSTAFVLWFGSAILASAVGFADAAAWTAFGRGIGLVATALLLVGYWPPRSVRERAARAEREATRRELSRDVALPTESALGGRHREPMLDRTRRRGSPAG